MEIHIPFTIFNYLVILENEGQVKVHDLHGRLCFQYIRFMQSTKQKNIEKAGNLETVANAHCDDKIGQVPEHIQARCKEDKFSIQTG